MVISFRIPATCTVYMPRCAASTSMVTELVGWISKSSTFSQTKFVTLEPRKSDFFRTSGGFNTTWYSSPTGGYDMICSFSIPLLNFSSCLKFTIYETHSFRITNELLPYNSSVRLEAVKEFCTEMPPPLPQRRKKISFYKIFWQDLQIVQKPLFAFAWDSIIILFPAQNWTTYYKIMLSNCVQCRKTRKVSEITPPGVKADLRGADRDGNDLSY